MAFWLLQCNPNRWRVFEYLADGHRLESWSVSRYLDKIAPGDRFAIWLTGRPGGVGAIGRVTRAAAEVVAGNPGDRYWAPEPPTGTRHEVGIEVEDYFFDSPVTRAELEKEPGFAGASILRSARSPNPYPLTEAEWAVMSDRLGREPDQPESLEWSLAPNEQITRSDLHDRYGGSRQSGISPCRMTPNILIFSDARSGERLGYVDTWGADDSFLYAGEGQVGNQTMKSGNRAILDHRADGRALRLFEGAGGLIRYVGEFAIDAEEPWQYVQARQRGSDELRRVIRFKLHRVAEFAEPVQEADLPTGTNYRREDDEIVVGRPAPRGGGDPDSHGRGLRTHRRLQNDLADMVRTAGFTPRSPAPHDPDFDLAWELADADWVVTEVKSLTRSNETRQLRMALGQVLDYADTLRARHSRVTPVIFLPHSPTSHRWIGLLEGHGVTVSWPGEEDSLPGLGLSPVWVKGNP